MLRLYAKWGVDRKDMVMSTSVSFEALVRVLNG